MDAQELRNLQEAYLDVVMNEKIEDENTPLRQQSHSSSFYGKDWKRKYRKRLNGGGHRMSKTERNSNNNNYSYIVDTGKFKKIRKEQVDIYDIILSHLLDEGYAETPEAAEAIMVNMSEEWRDSIINL
jgi:hypothetical protein